MFRGLASVLLGVHGRSRLADEVTRGALLHEIGVRLGASLDPGTTEELLGLEAEIQSAVFGMDQSATLETLRAHLDERLGKRRGLPWTWRSAPVTHVFAISCSSSPSERPGSRSGRPRIAEREPRIAERDVRVDELARLAAEREASIIECSQSMQAVLDQLSAVEASTSWKMTAPLRRLRRGS